MAVVRQGEIWWGRQPDQSTRPFLILTRQSALPVLGAVAVAPVTSHVRGLASEVLLGEGDGMRRTCAANLDNLATIRKSDLTKQAGQLAPGRWHEVCTAMRSAIDC